MTGVALGATLLEKLNMLSNEPEPASNDPVPIRWPLRNVSSMKWMIEDWSVGVLSMKFLFAHGEITSSGRRGPCPQRPCTGTPLDMGPARVAPPLTPLQMAASAVELEPLTMSVRWSYQPSESS